MSGEHRCRACGASLSHVVVDLGASPLANELVEPGLAHEAEPFFPLRLMLCERCWLVQLPAVATPQRIFGDYAYFSSFSSTWLAHGRRFAGAIIEQLELGRDSLVIEVASNDGCLLKEFMARGIGVLGIEPAKNVGAAAQAAGVPTLVEFFGSGLAAALAAQGRRADLLVANNVLAHVPELNDFIEGIATLLAPRGVATLEFPHVMRMIERGEFDTIYHEHYSYFSLLTIDELFARHGLIVRRVEELPTHGGSLRIEAVRKDGILSAERPAVDAVKAAERAAGLDSVSGYATLAASAKRAKRDLLNFLTRASGDGKRVAGYGAPAKATTLLNYCGVRSDLLEFTVDKNPRKQGRFVPGVRIPIEAPEKIFERKPDYVLILPWNISDEVRDQMAEISAWGGRFVVPIPRLSVFE